MSTWALVTGATAGIGESFSRLLASNNFNIVLVARDLPRLQERAKTLESRYGVKTHLIQADLSTDEGSNKVERYIAENQIDVLINNAGFGLNESFLHSSIEDEERVLDVLARVPMRLMHAVLPQMKQRNSGIIINVSSIASFIAGGHYSAAKSYLTVLSESLHTQLLPTEIEVLSLNPGFVRTEFHQRAGMKMGAIPDFMWLSVDSLVSRAWDDAKKGKAISVPGWQYKVLQFLITIAPRSTVRKMGMTLRTRQR